MKKIISGFIFSFAAFSVVSCDYNDPNDGKFGSDPESGWVQFVTDNAIVSAVGDCEDRQVTIPIHLDAPVNRDGVEVYYTITNVVGTAGNSVTGYGNIPAGSLNGEIVLNLGEGITSSSEFDVTLTSTSRSNVVIGDPNSTEPQVNTVKVYVGTRDRYIGTYDVRQVQNGNTSNYTSVVTAGTAPNELLISNLFNRNLSSQTRVFVNEDGTLSFPATSDNFLFTNPSGANFFLEGNSGGTVGTGDSCGGILSFDMRIRNASGNPVGAVANVVLTRR